MMLVAFKAMQTLMMSKGHRYFLRLQFFLIIAYYCYPYKVIL